MGLVGLMCRADCATQPLCSGQVPSIGSVHSCAFLCSTVTPSMEGMDDEFRRHLHPDPGRELYCCCWCGDGFEAPGQIVSRLLCLCVYHQNCIKAMTFEFGYEKQADARCMACGRVGAGRVRTARKWWRLGYNRKQAKGAKRSRAGAASGL